MYAGYIRKQGREDDANKTKRVKYRKRQREKRRRTGDCSLLELKKICP